MGWTLFSLFPAVSNPLPTPAPGSLLFVYDTGNGWLILAIYLIPTEKKERRWKGNFEF